MKTRVISAFPACGKTYAFENYRDTYKIMDSDSSDFSWVKDVEGNNTKQRHPDFPNNYIKHIKSNLHEYDIIFVSSHKEVRQALTSNNIKFCTVIPSGELLNEWVGRMYGRGDNEGFINFIIDNWDGFLDEIKDFNYGEDLIQLRSNCYLSLARLREMI